MRGIKESAVGFFSRGGHNHDGKNSSKIDLSAYIEENNVIRDLQENVANLNQGNGNDGNPLPGKKPNDGGPPGAPQNVIVTSGFNSLFIVWDPNTEIDMVNGLGQYRVEISEDSDFDPMTQTLESGSSNSDICLGLTTGVTYYVRVFAIDAWGEESPASDTATGIPDGIGENDGIPSVGTLPTLPHVDYPQGAVVFLTTDNKLYRSTGTAWTAEVPAVDITGTIGNTQIADDSITTAKILAGAVDVDRLAANSVTSSKIAADQVIAGKIAANAVDAAQIKADAVETSKIKAGAVVADKIAANQINAGHISTITLTASQFIRSSNYSAGVDGWNINAGGSAEFYNVAARGSLETGASGVQRIYINGNSINFYSTAGYESIPGSISVNNISEPIEGSSSSIIISAPNKAAGGYGNGGNIRITNNSSGTVQAHIEAREISFGTNVSGSKLFHRPQGTRLRRQANTSIPNSNWTTVPDPVTGLITGSIGAWDGSNKWWTPPQNYFNMFSTIHFNIFWELVWQISASGSRSIRFQAVTAGGGVVSTIQPSFEEYTSTRMSGIGMLEVGSGQSIRCQVFQSITSGALNLQEIAVGYYFAGGV